MSDGRLERPVEATKSLRLSELFAAYQRRFTDRAKDVIKYGTKTSNLGEIRTANLPDVNIPDGFGVPFYYYVRHMKQHGLDARVLLLESGRIVREGTVAELEADEAVMATYLGT